MRRAAALVTLLVSALVAASPAAAMPSPSGAAGTGGRIDARVAAAMQAADPTEKVPVVVVLRAQADLRAAGGRTRHQRLTRTIAALRDTATRSQAGLLPTLRALRDSGEVSRITPLWIVDAVSLSATPQAIDAIATLPAVASVQPDVTLAAPSVARTALGAASTAPTEPELTAVGVPQLWATGLDGTGVVVASMDTGVDVTHPDLAGRWRGGTNSWFDPNGQHATPVDVNGHGTWTTGVMVGGDAGGTSVGVAPGARWIGVKIFDDRGVASATNIHRGFQWLLDPDGNPATDDAPDVVNDSWTLAAGSCNLDFEPDLESLRAAGILPVFAAGNYGPSAGTVASPANNPAAFAVGATNSSDIVDTSSSRGPSTCTGGTAPQLTAPGVGIWTTDIYGGYLSVSGTSIAAPLVSGTLALLLQASPGLSADQQQAALQSSAVDLGTTGPDNAYGSGRLDAAAAYAALHAAPDFAVAANPSSTTVAPGGQASFQVSVSGLAGFGADVGLAVSGLPPGQGSATVSPTTVTGGSGTASLTVTTAGLPVGTYPLTVSATSGALTHSASVTLVVAPPPDFTVSAIPASRTVTAGSATTYSVTVSPLNGFTGAVGLSASGLPANVGTATVSPSSVTGSGTVTLRVTTVASAPGGSYPVTVTGSSGGLVHTTTVSVTVNAAPAAVWSISASPTSRTVSRGSSTTYTTTVTKVSGSPGPVALSVSGLPTGTTATWSKTSVTPTGTSTLTVRTTSTTPRGTYSVHLVGSGSGATHEVVVTLVVR